MIVNDDKLETCKIWAETIHQKIMESFTYFGYLHGLNVFLKKDEWQSQLSVPYIEFIKRQKLLLQASVCVNIEKLLFDKASDAYSLDNYRHKIEDYKGVRLTTQKPIIDKKYEKAVIDFGKKYSEHSIAYTDPIDIEISDLYKMLKLGVMYFDSITDDEFLDQNYRFNEDAIEKWIYNCASSVWEFISMNSQI